MVYEYNRKISIPRSVCHMPGIICAAGGIDYSTLIIKKLQNYLSYESKYH